MPYYLWLPHPGYCSMLVLFYAIVLCKTFMQFSINGLFISYGVSLWLKWTLHFTLNLNICYRRDYLHLLQTVVGISWSDSTNVAQIWGLFEVMGWGSEWKGGFLPLVRWLYFLVKLSFLIFTVWLETFPTVWLLQVDWSWSILDCCVWCSVMRLMRKTPFWMHGSFSS